MSNNSTSHLDHLDDICQEDAIGIKEAEKNYGSSWKLRGGVGAYFSMVRKIDRIENRCKQVPAPVHDHTNPGDLIQGCPYDIFTHIEADERAEGLIDDIRDLRRYLCLIEAEMRARGAKSAKSTHRDN